MAGIRTSKLETEKRVFEIQGWIVSGMPDYLIIKNIENKFKNKEGINVCRKTAQNLLKRAYTIWHQEQFATIEEKRTLRIAELKQDIRGMKETYRGTPQGMSVVNSIKKEITKLEALYPTPKFIIQGDKDKPLLVTNTEEREERIAQLIAKAMKTD